MNRDPYLRTSSKNWLRRLKRPLKAWLAPWFHSRMLRRLCRANRAWLHRVVLFDIGARWGISPPFTPLQPEKWFVSVGFEPDPQEAEQLKQDQSFNVVCATALAEAGHPIEIHIAADPGCSSMLPPNFDEISRWCGTEIFRTTGRYQATALSLDEAVRIHQLPGPDYVKLDVEGAEDRILQGAAQSLKGVTGLVMEARFREFYRGEALADALIRRALDQGYALVHLKFGGSFHGALVACDLSFCRRADLIAAGDPAAVFKAMLFCVLNGNAGYARHILNTAAAQLDPGMHRQLKACLIDRFCGD